MAKPVIITCAPTGGIHTPTMSEHLPITPPEVLMEVPPRIAPGGLSEIPKKGVGRPRPRMKLAEHGEAHPVIHPTHLFGPLGAFELLPPEIARGRAQHHQALLPVARI